MKAKRKTGLLAAVLTLSLLLSACGDKPAASSQDSGFGTQAPQTTTTTAAQPPQTTASPQEQTGFGYRLETAEGGTGAQPTDIFTVGDTVYLDVPYGAEGQELYTLEGEQVPLPEVEGEIAAIGWDDAAIWLCVDSGGLTMVRMLSDGTQEGEPIPLSDSDGSRILDLAVGGDGNFYLLYARAVEVYSPSGKRLSELPLSGIGSTMLRLEDGQVLMSTTDEPLLHNGGGSVALLTTESIGASLVDGTLQYRAFGGWGSTALLSGGGNLYTLDTTTGEMQTLLNWVDTGVDPGQIIAATALGQEHIEVITGSYGDWSRATLTQVPASELEEKTVITVGLGSLEVLPLEEGGDTTLRDAITARAVAFNRESQDCRIHLVDYSVYTDCNERLREDLQDLDLAICKESILEGAALTDLTGLFDGDVSREGLVPGVAEALEAEGMTSLPLYFTVKTLVGCKGVLGESQGWTPSAFLETVKANSGGAVLQFCNAYDTLDAIVAAAGGAVEDYGALLEAASLVPVDDGAIYELEGNGTGSVYSYLREGKLLLLETEIGQFMELKTLEAALGQDLVLKGYPTDRGNGAVLNMPLRLAIPDSSQHKAEAWAFLKELLTGSEETLSQLGIGFPVLEEAFAALGQEAIDSVRYTDDNGQEVTTVWVDGEAVTVSPMTQADIDAFRDYCAASSGSVAGSEELRDQARSALKRVLEEGTEPQTAAADIHNQ